MRRVLRIMFLFMVLCLFNFCTFDNSKIEKVAQLSYLCDSSKSYTEDSSVLFDCYYGNSLITIKTSFKNDTNELTRYHLLQNRWQVQEYLIMKDNQVVYPRLAFYCQVKDTMSFLKLNFIEDEKKNEDYKATNSEDYKFLNFLRLEVISNKDTVVSNSRSILISKKKYSGSIKLVKYSRIFYKGKEHTQAASITLEMEIIKKYGDVRGQYSNIVKVCGI